MIYYPPDKVKVPWRNSLGIRRPRKERQFTFSENLMVIPFSDSKNLIIVYWLPLPGRAADNTSWGFKLVWKRYDLKSSELLASVAATPAQWSTPHFLADHQLHNRDGNKIFYMHCIQYRGCSMWLFMFYNVKENLSISTFEDIENLEVIVIRF